MVDTKIAQEKSREALYATLGAGDLAVEKAKDAAEWIRYYYTPAGFRKFWTTRRKRAEKTFAQLSERGRKLATSVRSSAPVKRAGEQTKTAQSQVKAAATSVRKALGANVEATKAAAKKVS